MVGILDALLINTDTADRDEVVKVMWDYGRSEYGEPRAGDVVQYQSLCSVVGSKMMRQLAAGIV
jgi:hypothetical protein